LHRFLFSSFIVLFQTPLYSCAKLFEYSIGDLKVFIGEQRLFTRDRPSWSKTLKFENKSNLRRGTPRGCISGPHIFFWNLFISTKTPRYIIWGLI